MPQRLFWIIRGGDLQNVLKAQAAKEKIDLLEKHIAVVTRRIEQSQWL
jgi:hypothetical protein